MIRSMSAMRGISLDGGQPAMVYRRRQVTGSGSFSGFGDHQICATRPNVGYGGEGWTSHLGLTHRPGAALTMNGTRFRRLEDAPSRVHAPVITVMGKAWARGQVRRQAGPA